MMIRRPGTPTGVDRERSRPLPIGLLAAVTTVLMLQGTRVLATYLTIVADNRGWLYSAGIALAVSGALTTLAVAMRRHGELRVWIAVLVGSRLLLQFWEQPEARAALGVAIVGSWCVHAPALLGTHRAAASLGVVAGLGLDLAIRIAFGTLDLPWATGRGAVLLTILLAALLILPLPRLRDGAEQGSSAGTVLLGVGPGLALYHLVAGNLGLAQVKLGLTFPAAAAVLAIGVTLGVAIGGTLTARPSRHRVALVLLIAALGWIGILLGWRGGAFAAPGMILGAAAITLGIARILKVERTGVPNTGRRDALWLAGGIALALAILAAYYTLSGSGAVLVWCGVLLTTAALRASGGSVIEPVRRRYGTTVAAVVGILLFAACAGQMVVDRAPPRVGHVGPDLTVMTFNIRAGFAHDGTWSLERTARTIEEQRPDVVVLQEVSRGWLGRTGTDEVLWLRRRLGMQLVFGAATVDGLWGNALLTRLPIERTEQRQYAVTRNLQRSALMVRLGTRWGAAWVLTTHLAAPKDAGVVRLAQTGEMLALVDGRRPTLIMGDLNADPGSPELRLLSGAGFDDIGRTLGPGAYTSLDLRRIDYILASGEWETSDVRILEMDTSDHRAVVARVRLSGQGQR